MIKACIKSLLRSEFDKYKIFIHNLSNFDGIFLLKQLMDNYIVEPIINDGRIISIKISAESIDDNKKMMTLTFLDSYQMLPASLKSLTNAFDTNTKKDIFPHSFVNENNLNYIGEVPLHHHFPN